MELVRCADVRDGLRSSEATVAVSDIRGSKQYLRVEREFLVEKSGVHYLPIGVVGHDGNRALIELPHEADSGANRLWVDNSLLGTAQ